MRGFIFLFLEIFICLYIVKLVKTFTKGVIYGKNNKYLFEV